MHIQRLDREPIQQLMYLRAAVGGGSESAMLPITHGVARGLPDGLDALLLTSDLQGRCPAPDGARPLLGEALADHVAQLGWAGLWPTPDRVGVVLAGDLFSAEACDQRGATGDVRAVWRAFADRFAWVVGVQGNHDLFGTEGQRIRFFDHAGADLLDGDVVERGGVRFGGVGLVIGREGRAGRRERGAQLRRVEAVVAADPAVLVLHEGPPDGEGRRGQVALDDATAGVGLVVCGHSAWDAPLRVRAGGGQVLNVDGRAVLLRRG